MHLNELVHTQITIVIEMKNELMFQKLVPCPLKTPLSYTLFLF